MRTESTALNDGPNFSLGEFCYWRLLVKVSFVQCQFCNLSVPTFLDPHQSGAQEHLAESTWPAFSYAMSE